MLIGAAMIFHHHLVRVHSNYEKLRIRAEDNLQNEEARINSFLDKIEKNFSISKEFTLAHLRYLNSLTESIHGFTLFVFYRDSLYYWSDNSVYFNLRDLAATSNQQSIRMGNGFFELFQRSAGDKKLVALLKIKSEFPIENQYLQNTFNERLGLNRQVKMSPVTSERIFPVHSSRGNVLFSLSFAPLNDYSGLIEGEQTIGILYLTGIALFMVFAFILTYRLLHTKPLIGLLVIIGITALRIWGIMYRIPEAMYALPLFSPKYYASSFMLYSLGDLLLSSVVFCYIITSLYTYYESKSASGTSVRSKIGTSVRVIFIWLFTFLFSVLINYLLSSLIINSKISFNINNIFELTGFSIIGFLIIGFLLFSFYLVCDGGIRFILRTRLRLFELSILFLITQGIFLLLLINLRDSLLFKNYGISAFLLANLLILFIGFVRKQAGRVFSFSRTILFILGFSFYAAQTIFDFNTRRTRESMKAVAQKLENAQDAIAEYLFEEVVTDVRKDHFIRSFFTGPFDSLLAAGPDHDLLFRRMMESYFNGYWNKFEIQIRAFNAQGEQIRAGGMPGHPLEYYDRLIESSGKPTYSPGFYLVNSESGMISYIGKINIPSPVLPDSIIGTMITELNSKLLNEDSGYPDLLLGSKLNTNRDFYNYSYARYKNHELINQFGRYAYNLIPTYYDTYINLSSDEQYVRFGANEHLFYRPSKDTLIIVSIEPQGALEMVTLFSYLFSFFCLVFILIYVIYKLIQTRFRPQLNFKNRVQFMVITIVVLSMLIIGASTVAYIVNNYSKTQGIKLRERLNSMLAAINRDIPDIGVASSGMNTELTSRFNHLYSTVNVDFNIYSESGRLLYSTQPKLFEHEVVAPLMHSIVLREFRFSGISTTINFEEIGSLGFLTGYAAIRNRNNAITGYLNLPYFARASELKREISSFLVALINIYVLLFAISVVLTFIVSTRITNPLKIIQERMSRVKLGKRNQPITWKNKDEIGALIDEYNRMIEELADSAQRLAKSERETAWREMAKQVAHEIKNPLTPMKLSVQHLQRAWKDKPGDMEDIMQRFSNTLIEQIDALSNIATEFSNFAKMPGATFAPVNISAILKSSVNLYRENEHIVLKQYDFTNGDIDVYADKDQLLRVFSNLLKNAVQAVPAERQGQILVKITHDENHCMISISDNGLGIPEDKIPKIFTPNFTTKTGGTGLGLAMVKNIIENSNGTIRFETEAGKGTTFYVSFPVYKGI